MAPMLVSASDKRWRKAQAEYGTDEVGDAAYRLAKSRQGVNVDDVGHPPSLPRACNTWAAPSIAKKSCLRPHPLNHGKAATAGRTTTTESGSTNE